MLLLKCPQRSLRGLEKRGPCPVERALPACRLLDATFAHPTRKSDGFKTGEGDLWKRIRSNENRG